MGGLDFSGQGVDVNVVPLHRNPFEGSGVGRRVGRPVIQPGDFRAWFGKGKDGVYIVHRPAKAAFAVWRHENLNKISMRFEEMGEEGEGHGNGECTNHSSGAMTLMPA